MVTIKAKVHRLPTEDKTEIGVAFNGLHYMTDELHRQHIAQYQHLYITTDEEIKEGDWFYYNHNGGVIGQYKKGMGEIDGKIIATTDPKIIGKSKITETKNVIRHSIFPSIPQSFIEEYCKAGGIDEVLVEYGNGYLAKGDSLLLDGISYKPKLNPDNTIIIHPVEEKMYSRDEAIELIENYRIYAWKKGLTVNDFDKWIEENL